MILPTQIQIEAGDAVARELVRAKCRVEMGPSGMTIPFNLDDFKFKHIIQAYVAGEIDAATGIWVAMQEAA